METGCLFTRTVATRTFIRLSLESFPDIHPGSSATHSPPIARSGSACAPTRDQAGIPDRARRAGPGISPCPDHQARRHGRTNGSAQPAHLPKTHGAHACGHERDGPPSPASLSSA